MKTSLLHPKTAMITGATSGIGKATAFFLAQQGIHTVIVGRNADKCLTTARSIKKMASSDAVEFLVGDLSSLSEIRRFAEAFNAQHQHLDILVNNVGARFMQYSQNHEGFEMTFALNHLSSFLLTHLLMDALSRSQGARIVNVASGAHAQSMDFESLLCGADNFDGRKAYAQSKLANLMFTYELSRRLADKPVTVNAVDPGGVATNFNRNNGMGYWLRHILAHILSRNLTGPKKGADTSVWVAVSPEADGISGKYFRYRQEIRSSRGSYDTDAQTELWNLSEELTGLKK